MDGQLSSSQFYKEMLTYVKQTTDGFIGLDMSVAEKQVVVVGKCLKCGQPVVEGFKGYTCSNKACKFFISKMIMKGKLPQQMLRNY